MTAVWPSPSLYFRRRYRTRGIRHAHRRQRHSHPLHGRGRRSLAGDEPFAGLQPKQLGSRGSGPRRPVSCAAFRHARARRHRCTGGGLHAGPARRRPAGPAGCARDRPLPLHGVVDGRHDRHDACPQAPRPLRSAAAVQHVEPYRSRSGADLEAAHRDGRRRRDGADHRADPVTLVHGAISHRAPGRHGHGGRNDPVDAARGLHRLLPCDTGDRPDRPAGRDRIADAGHRRGPGCRDAGGNGACDPVGHSRCAAGRAAACFAPVQPRAPRAVRPPGGRFSRG